MTRPWISLRLDLPATAGPVADGDASLAAGVAAVGRRGTFLESWHGSTLRVGMQKVLHFSWLGAAPSTADGYAELAFGQGLASRAGDGTRTHDVQLGKL